MTEQKTSCPACGQHVAFPDDMLGQTINCPSCNSLVTLNAILTPPILKRNVFLRIIDGLVRLNRRRKAIAAARIAARKQYISDVISGLKCAPVLDNDDSDLILQKSEKIYWKESASLIEMKTVGRHYEGSSAGISFRVARGVRFNVGRRSGHSVSDKAAIHTSSGCFIITNKRIAFVGDQKSFALKLESVLNIQPGTNGVKFTDGHGTSKMIEYYNHRNADVVCAVLNFAFDNNIA